MVDEFYHVSLQTRRKLTKVLERVVRPLQEAEFNTAIRKKIDVFSPGIVLVYKGAFVRPETLDYARSKGCKLVLFYPDVSLTNHGPNIPACLPRYDLAFTTKTFGITDMQKGFGVKNAVLIPHGYDPEIHRGLTVSNEDMARYGCDASFIGTWSPKKEAWLSHLATHAPEVNLRVWGDQWFKATNPALKQGIQGTAVLGDLYAVAIQCSTINLGILSEIVVGASSGDLITSRTFHIPGASGFMLHERNEESVLYFDEDREAGFFAGPEEMTAKVKYFLQHTEQRLAIQEAGNQRAKRDHSLDARARTVIGHMRHYLY